MIPSGRFTADLPVEAGRYRLVTSPLCPWCRRVTLARRLLGLDDAIALTQASGRGEDGFTFTGTEASFDPTIRAASVRELYRRDPRWQPGEPTTVPLLLDEATDPAMIVVHESADLLVDFAETWRDLHRGDAPELLPADRRDEVVARLERVGRDIAGPAGAILHDRDVDANAQTLARGLAWAESWLSDDLTLAHLALFTPLTSLVQATGATYLPAGPIREWYNRRATDPVWLPADERAALFGEADPRVTESRGVTYAAAGVDIEAGDRAVDLMRAAVAATYTDAVVTDSGSFAGMVEASALRGMRRPLLATSTDGVGTKVALAQALDRHDTIGQDLVGMVVDDIVVTGAKPLLMTDYIACGRVNPERIATIVRGIAQACAAVRTPLLGGETAEHPGLMAPDEYDVAGAATGVVEADEALGAHRVAAGDVVVAMASSGLHANGFSLVRAIVAQAGWELTREVAEFGRTLGEELLEPTRLYTAVCLDQLAAVGARGLHALSHITGGGLGANVSRVLPVGLTAMIDRSTWQVPAVFQVMQRLGGVPVDDLEQTLNMGVGMVALVASDAVDEVCRIAHGAGIEAWEVGRVVASADADLTLPGARVVEGAKGVDGGRALLHAAYRM